MTYFSRTVLILPLVAGIATSSLNASAMLETSSMTSAEAGGKEYQIKCAIMLNIIKFTDWPANNAPKGTFTIGIVGKDPFGPVADKIFGGKDKGGAKFAFKNYDSLGAIPDSDLGSLGAVFVTDAQCKEIPGALPKLEGAGVLVVGDSDGSAKGGHVAVPVIDGKVKIQVNQGQIEKTGFKMNAKLLQSATIIK